MYLFEYQAKDLMRQWGIPVLPGAVAITEVQAREVAQELGCGPWAVKAQIYAGGRAQGSFSDAPRSGGIRFSDSLDGVHSAAASMLGATLVTPQTGAAGQCVSAVYIEPQVKTQGELFVALLVDGESGEIVCLATPRGGENIEEQVRYAPESLIKTSLGSGSEIVEQGVRIGSALGLEQASCTIFADILQRMYQLFVTHDLSLIEINPLGIEEDGRLIALDGRMAVDNNALFRQPKMASLSSRAETDAMEESASRYGFNYIRLDGNVGTFSSGAGLAMATLDAVVDLGGKPANFLDVPPVLEVSRVKQAFLLALTDSRLRCLLLNIFGAGIMRCDTIADGLLLAHLEKPITVDIVARLAGTNAQLAISRLERSGLPIRFAPDLASAAKMAVELAATPDRPKSRGTIVGQIGRWLNHSGGRGR
jgi:succinyl-CoA synthetase beta subunit